jgi:hypothetical protein
MREKQKQEANGGRRYIVQISKLEEAVSKTASSHPRSPYSVTISKPYATPHVSLMPR